MYYRVGELSPWFLNVDIFMDALGKNVGKLVNAVVDVGQMLR